MKRTTALFFLLVLSVGCFGFRQYSYQDHAFVVRSNWIPTDAPNCVLWLTSDYGVTIDTTTGTNTISRWNDQSGNGNDAVQGIKASQPIFGSNLFGLHPALIGTNGRLWYLSVTNLFTMINNGGFTNMTIGAVYRPYTTNTGACIIAWGNHTNWQPQANFRFNVSTNWSFQRIFFGGNQQSITLPSKQLIMGGMNALSMTVAGGAAQTMNNQYTTVGAGLTNGNGLWTRCSIGAADRDTVGSPMWGELYAMVVYNKALSSNDQVKLQNYFNKKYLVY